MIKQKFFRPDENLQTNHKTRYDRGQSEKIMFFVKNVVGFQGFGFLKGGDHCFSKGGGSLFWDFYNFLKFFRFCFF